LILLFLGCGGMFVGCDATYSEGYRDGTIQKFSHKGMIFQSWEGELAQAGFKVKAAANAESNAFEFSVDDPTIIAEIQNLKPDEHIRLHYRQVLKNASAWHSTDYRITKIVRLENKK
jgi:hypothetical protein